MLARLNSLSARMITTVVVVFLFTAPPIFYVSYVSAKAQHMAHFERLAQRTAADLAVHYQAEGPEGRARFIAEHIELIPELVSLSFRPAHSSSPSQTQWFKDESALLGTDDLWRNMQPISDQAGEFLGNFEFAFDLRHTQASLDRLRNVMLISGVFFFVISIAMIGTLAAIIGRGFDNLREAARAIASGNTERPFKLRSSMPDMQSLAADLESMRSELVRNRRDIDSQRSLLESMFASESEGIVTLSGDGRIRSLNGMAQQMFGRTAQELIDRPATTILHGLPLARDNGPMTLKNLSLAETVALEGERCHGGRFPLRGLCMHFYLDSQPVVVLVLREVADPERLRQELLAVRQENLAILESLNDIVLVADNDHRLVRWNSAAETVGGYHADELRDRSLFDFVGAEDVEACVEALERLFRGEHVQLEVAVITKDGRTLPYQWSGGLLRDSFGAVCGCILVGRDIGERWEMEKLLRERGQSLEHRVAVQTQDIKRAVERLYEEIEERARTEQFLKRTLSELETQRFALDQHSIVAITDASGAITYVNEQFCAISGYSDDELIGRNHRLLKSGFHPDSFYDEMWQTISRGDVWKGEICNCSKGGQLYWVNTTIVPFVDEAGLPYQYVAIRTDITDEKHREAALQESEERFKHIAQSMSDWIWEINEEGRYVFSDGKVNEILGYEAHELMGHTPFEFMEPEEAARVEPLCRQLFAERKPIRDLENWNVTKDGRSVCLLTNGMPVFDAEGRFRGYRGVDTDITVRKRAERAMREARDQALVASKLKSEFIANVSHEIRTPMNAVLGMLELLADAELNVDQRQLVDTAYRSAESLLTVLNDILDFSKIESGQLVLESVDFDLRSLLYGVAELFSYAAHQKGLDLVLMVSPDVPRQVVGDPTRLRQVLTNLLSNAVKFTEQGDVTLAVSMAAPAAAQPEIMFSVSDTGVGIPKDDLGKVFESFIQADGSLRRRYGGTGLGLTISKQLIDLMGGHIDVESVTGEGSRFWFSLALDRAAAPERGVTSYVDLSRLKVLVVDDSRVARTAVVEQLRSWGMRVSAVADAATALQRLRNGAAKSRPFDLAVLDIQLPDQDGISLSREIKADPRLEAVKLIAVTKLGLRGQRGTAQRAGIEAYLSKPVRQSDLFDCIATVMTRREEDERQLVTRHSIQEAEDARQVRILVAEDNEVNQKVALTMLAKLGYRADMVENGIQAVEAVQQGGYHLVLMDCQMPEMDGYAATARIRAAEAVRHIPIIAMTANAMEGDQDQCLAAGMDDYIAKPVRLEVLKQTLERWLPARGFESQHAETAMEQSLDRNAIEELQELLGDEFPDLVQTFLADVPRRLDELHRALETHDWGLLEKASHSLKGSSSNLGARRLASVCSRLVEQCRAGMVVDAPGQVASIEGEVKDVLPQLKGLL